MFEGWSISLAGCGFMGVYYIGALSCILERAPHLIQGASKVYGASAGALIAGLVTSGIPIEIGAVKCMSLCKEARRRKLGPLHPAFNLLQLVRDIMISTLPEDAHVRVSGRLCVSLTRVSDGKNVIVSEFETREELIQAIICSCFIPFYCGVIPPVFRGVRYVDGAISDNLPRCNLKNTVTFSPYSGESDVCPRASSTLNFHEIRFNNVSVQVNVDNMYRVASTFFPPETEKMAEICNNGYIDALRFLQQIDLPSEGPSTSEVDDNLRAACCELEDEASAAEETESSPQNTPQNRPPEHHQWLDPRLIENLPVIIKKVLCEACRERHAGGLLSKMTEFLPIKMASYLLMPCTLPLESACLLIQRLVDWIPGASGDMRWLYRMAGDIYKEAWKGKEPEREPPLRRCASLPSGLEHPGGGLIYKQAWKGKEPESEPPLRRCASLPSGLERTGEEDPNRQPLTPAATSIDNFHWDVHSGSVVMTPPSTPTTPKPEPWLCPKPESECDAAKADGGGWGHLGRAVGWIRNTISEQSSSPGPSDDPADDGSLFKDGDVFCQ